MNDQPPSRGGSAALLASLFLAASALGGWYLFSQRNSSTIIDTGGFDVGATPKSPDAALVAVSVPASAAPSSGLALIKVDEEIRSAPRPRAENKAVPAPAPARTIQQARMEFTAQVRQNEGVVRRFAERMTAQSPVIRQYGKDWMSHPDLKKLNDDYMRDHDPIAFMQGLIHAPSAALMLKQYAGAPDIRSFVVVGVTKECPQQLALAGLDLMHQDSSLKGILTEIQVALGMPADTAAALTSKRSF